jgi:hypothetical protein
VPAREGPAEKSISHFEVHEGTTVRIEDQEGDYRRVKLANGLTGWIPQSAVELVVPPGWAGRPVMAGSPRADQPRTWLARIGWRRARHAPHWPSRPSG